MPTTEIGAVTNKRQLSRSGKRVRNLVILGVLIVVIVIATSGHSSPSAAYSVSDVGSSIENPSTLLVDFAVNNTGSATGTPTCIISASGITSEAVSMKPVKNGNTEIVPAYPFEVPAGDASTTQVKIACGTNLKLPSATGKAVYTVRGLSVTRAGVNNTVLDVTFQLTNTGTRAGAPTCTASYKGGTPQTIDLLAFGSVYPSKTLNPHVTNFVKDASIVASNAQTATGSDVKVMCR